MTDETSENPAKNKGGRPRKQVDTSSPEFKAAVTAGIDAAIPRLAEMVKQASAASGNPLASAEATGDMDFVRKLALAIGEISDQGTQRKRVAPEILAQRADARDKMIALVIDNRVNKRTAHYRLIAQTYLAERLLQPFMPDPMVKGKVVPTEIEFDSIPNEAMQPINEVAQEVFGLFMESIGGATRIDAKTHNGLSFMPDPRPYSVTTRGLVVKGELSKRTMVGSLPDSNQSVPSNPHDPNAMEIRVLGTVAPPARQNVVGNAA